MQPTIRFKLDASDIELAEKLQANAAKNRRRKSPRTWGQQIGGFASALLYGLPAMIFFVGNKGQILWLVGYLIVAPWIVVMLFVPIERKRRAAATSAELREYEATLSESALEISCGDLSSKVLSGGVGTVERLDSHIAVTLTNLVVFLFPLSANGSESAIQQWLYGLASLSSNNSFKPKPLRGSA
jgi:hypothetical protein